MNKMALTIIGKGSIDLLEKIDKDLFESYELYIKILDDKTFTRIINLPEHVKIFSIHNPSTVIVSNTEQPFNLTDKGEIGSESLKALQKTIELAKQCNAELIVIHGALYNTENTSRDEALKIIANHIKSLESSAENIKLSFEIDALWYPRYYPQRALMVSENEFSDLQNHLEKKIGITVDIEHLELTHYFEEFQKIEQNNEFIEKSKCDLSQENRNTFDKLFTDFQKNNKNELSNKFNNKLKSFFNYFNNNINHIHICGSDPNNFTLNPKSVIPLAGEHLPLNFNNNTLTDQFDYNLISELLKSLPKEKDIKIVIEIWRENQEELLKEMINSAQYLKELLK